jgi:hypothetical protein
MNKKHFLQAVESSIKAADESDANRSHSSGDDTRRYSRHADFLAHFTGYMSRECPEATALISEFQRRVLIGKNPLLDAADSGKEPK